VVTPGAVVVVVVLVGARVVVVVLVGTLISSKFQVSVVGVTEKLAGVINQNPNLLPPKFIMQCIQQSM
jgi:hypothetical protein